MGLEVGGVRFSALLSNVGDSSGAGAMVTELEVKGVAGPPPLVMGVVGAVGIPQVLRDVVVTPKVMRGVVVEAPHVTREGGAVGAHRGLLRVMLGSCCTVQGPDNIPALYL